LGVALTKLKVEEHVQIDIYESASKLTQVGAGITFWPRGWEIMKNMGLEDSLIGKLTSSDNKPNVENMSMCFLSGGQGQILMVFYRRIALLDEEKQSIRGYHHSRLWKY